MRDPREATSGEQANSSAKSPILLKSLRVVANLWAAEKGILADATRNRRQHKRRVLKINQASWNVAHVAAYEFFGCVARARGPAAGGLRTPALPAGAR